MAAFFVAAAKGVYVLTLSLLNVITSYLIAQRQAGKSDATLQQYGYHLGKMATWLGEAGVLFVAEVQREDLRAWGATLRDTWSPATIKGAVCAARSFFRWCKDDDLLTYNPALALKVPRVPVRAQRTLTAAEITTLLAGCPDSLRGTRDAALVALLLDTGLRNAEICRLRLPDLDLQHRHLLVRIKGGDEAFGYFGSACSKRLQAWLRVRHARAGVQTVFVSVGGNTPGCALTERGLRLALKRLGQRAGVPGVCPHAFRRSFATLMLLNGAPSRIVQLAGRWSDLRMVERYSQQLDASSVYGRWSPLDGLEP